jgi:hypothetical protein
MTSNTRTVELRAVSQATEAVSAAAAGPIALPRQHDHVVVVLPGCVDAIVPAAVVAVAVL